VVNTSSRYFHVLFYDIKYISNRLHLFLKLLHLLKKAVANKSLNGTTGVVEDIKCHHVEQVNSFFHSLVVFIFMCLQSILTQTFGENCL